MSNVLTLVGLSFLLIFFLIMFTKFAEINAQIKCPEMFEVNEELGLTDYFTLLFNTRCSGIPIWFQALVYVPIILGILRAIISLSA